MHPTSLAMGLIVEEKRSTWHEVWKVDCYWLPFSQIQHFNWQSTVNFTKYFVWFNTNSRINIITKYDEPVNSRVRICRWRECYVNYFSDRAYFRDAARKGDAAAATACRCRESYLNPALDGNSKSVWEIKVQYDKVNTPLCLSPAYTVNCD